MYAFSECPIGRCSLEAVRRGATHGVLYVDAKRARRPGALLPPPLVVGRYLSAGSFAIKRLRRRLPAAVGRRAPATPIAAGSRWVPGTFPPDGVIPGRGVRSPPLAAKCIPPERVCGLRWAWRMAGTVYLIS